MTPLALSKGLNILATQLEAILEPNSTISVLRRAEQRALTMSRLRHPRSRKPSSSWSFEISRQEPLRFRETILHDYRIQADLYCRFSWSEDEISERSITVRIWALEEEMIYRPGLDAQAISDFVREGSLDRRVMLRFHFDMAGSGVSELKHHLQMGGQFEDEEWCWLHPRIDIPRFPYPPVDLFLVCELIGSNLFAPQYGKIRTDPSWVGQIKDSQAEMYAEYFAGCAKALRDGESVLIDYLWQS